METKLHKDTVSFDKQVEQIENTTKLLKERVEFISAYRDGIEDSGFIKRTIYTSYIESALTVIADLENSLSELHASLEEEL